MNPNGQPWRPGLEMEWRHYKAKANRTIPRILRHCKARRLVVQAGGHRGAWPLYLSRYFEKVYTFEPHAQNFNDLITKMPANVLAHHAALGDVDSFVTIGPGNKPTTGGYWVRRGGQLNAPGCVHMLRVDDLKLPVLDALVLDVEGCELPALKGAEQSILQFKPLIVVECHPPHSRRFGYDFEELEAWVQARGYRPRRHLIGKDVFYAPCAADGRFTDTPRTSPTP